MTTTTALGLLALGGSAITTGVLLAVAISLVPVFMSLPAGAYVRVHKVAGRYFDRFMPPTVMATTVVEIVLAVRSQPPALPLFVLAALFLVGVSVVSQFGNVPINRRVKALPVDDPPVNWPDPRGRWRVFHWWRTSFAVAALITSLMALYLG